MARADPLGRDPSGQSDSILLDHGVAGRHTGRGEIRLTSDLGPANAVASSARSELLVPPGAIVVAARFVVVVDPPGRSRIGDVAEVRAVAPEGDASAEIVIDFKTMQTVSEIELTPSVPGIKTLYPWLGTKFGSEWDQVVPAGVTTSPVDGFRSMAFHDVLTEKLLCGLDASIAPEALSDSQVVLPAPPAFVEILINDVRAWFSPIGPASPRELDGIEGAHAFAAAVDLTTEMQLALDADGTLAIELRVSSPAQLQFHADPLRYFRTHDVLFLEGPTRGFEAPDEGIYEIELPLPDEEATETWEIHMVEMQLRADIDETRIWPPTGPAFAGDVELVLADSRTLLVKLPQPLISRFGTVTGIRVPVRAATSGGELAGELLADASTGEDSRPGAEIADGAFESATVPASDALAFLTLRLKKPYEPAPEPGASLWSTLRATRGEVTWALGLPSPGDDLEGADVRWRAPNGSARSLSSFGVPGASGSASHAGAVRIVGTRDPNRPLEAVTVEMVGATGSLSLTPFETGSAVRLDLAEPLSPGAPRSVRVRFVVSAPGSYTIDRARLIYIDPALDEPPETDGGTG